MGARDLTYTAPHAAEHEPEAANWPATEMLGPTRGDAGLCAGGSLAAAEQFAELAESIDRQARREGRTLPTQSERASLFTAFWDGMVTVLDQSAAELGRSAEDTSAREIRDVLNPWLRRGRYWDRSLVKPHGYPGDYRMLEWMYDLEDDDCADPSQPAIVNLLDELFKSVDSVHAVWARRAWFAELIAGRLAEMGAPVRVLDVACGGSRYVRDVMQHHGTGAVHATFVDQDPSALAFVKSWLPAAADANTRLICAPVKRLAHAVALRAERELTSFDVVISTGLFDYLDEEAARVLLAEMTALTKPGGVVAVCNFSPEDPSRIVKQWIVDWPLIYRSPSQLASLFGPEVGPELSRSPDGGLLYARAVRVATRQGATR